MVHCLRGWRKTLTEWKKRHRRGCLTKVFHNYKKKTLTSVAEAESNNVVSGFRACGRVPLDRQQVLKRLP